MGNVGENPKSHSFENGNLVVRFSLATNDYYVKLPKVYNIIGPALRFNR
jgi:hypothetical protein